METLKIIVEVLILLVLQIYHMVLVVVEDHQLTFGNILLPQVPDLGQTFQAILQLTILPPFRKPDGTEEDIIVVIHLLQFTHLQLK